MAPAKVPHDRFVVDPFYEQYALRQEVFRGHPAT